MCIRLLVGGLLVIGLLVERRIQITLLLGWYAPRIRARLRRRLI